MMGYRIAALVLALAGVGWSATCYEVDGSSWVQPEMAVPYTCDYDYTTCNPYLHGPRLVTIDCSGHPKDPYNSAYACQRSELSECYYADGLTPVPPVLYVSAPAEHWEAIVDPDDPVNRGKYRGVHTKHRGAATVQQHYRGMPMMMGQGFMVTDQCQSVSGICLWYTWQVVRDPCGP
ncbi:MAG TPA: hypothetical protein PLQ54_13785 [Armatimonadota bacterium]|nr:hypothetical protein [Armatimonadota bacterium]